MRKYLLLMLVSVFFMSCEQDELTKHLRNGLVNYERTRIVNENLIDDVVLEKFAVFKTGPETYKLVLKLNNNFNIKNLELYKVAFESYLNEENIKLRSSKSNNNKQGFNFDVKLEKIKDNLYIINTIETRIKTFESLDIWFYQMQNGVYQGAGGNRVTIKNIGL